MQIKMQKYKSLTNFNYLSKYYKIEYPLVMVANSGYHKSNTMYSVEAIGNLKKKISMFLYYQIKMGFGIDKK